ncbi:MAG TPA: hypothetical protein VF735_06680 [Pyrinomonadaceae bacterium]|jgi:hypothetical protein
MKEKNRTRDIYTRNNEIGAKVEGLTTEHDKICTTTSHGLDAEQRGRVWEHGLHEDKLFHDRLNFFSFLESALLGIFGVLYSKQPPAPKSFLISLAALGITSTLLWLFIQLRHWSYLNHLVGKNKEILPEFEKTVDDFSKNKRWRRFSVTRLMALFIPILFIIVWLVTLISMSKSAEQLIQPDRP